MLTPQTHASMTDWSFHMSEWPSSGLSQKAYCAREKINFCKFKNQRYRWLKQRKLEPAKSPIDKKVSLKPLLLKPAHSSANPGTELLLELPAGIRLTIRSGS